MTNPNEPRLEPAIVELPTQATLVARFDDLTMAGVRDAMDRGFAAVGAALAASGTTPVGPAFSKYEGDPSATFSLELGFPVPDGLAEPVREGEVVVIASSLPATRAVVVSHLGAYDGLGAAWGGLTSWVEAHQARPAGPFWEVYVTEPTPDADPASMRTDLVLPLAD